MSKLTSELELKSMKKENDEIVISEPIRIRKNCCDKLSKDELYSQINNISVYNAMRCVII